MVWLCWCIGSVIVQSYSKDMAKRTMQVDFMAEGLEPAQGPSEAKRVMSCCCISISMIMLNLSHVTLVSDLWNCFPIRLYLYRTLERCIFCKRVTIITPEKHIVEKILVKRALSEDCPSTTTFHLHPYVLKEDGGKATAILTVVR